MFYGFYHYGFIVGYFAQGVCELLPVDFSVADSQVLVVFSHVVADVHVYDFVGEFLEEVYCLVFEVCVSKV